MKHLLYGLLISFSISCHDKKQETTGLEGKPMPSFKLLLMDSITYLNTNDIPSTEPIVLLFISPFCPYCKSQTENIIKDIKSFANVRIYILTGLPFNSLKQFYTDYKLQKYSNIIVGYDFAEYFPQYYNVQTIPYLAIFNKEKILKRVLKGKAETKLIKAIINK